MLKKEEGFNSTDLDLNRTSSAIPDYHLLNQTDDVLPISYPNKTDSINMANQTSKILASNDTKQSSEIASGVKLVKKHWENALQEIE